MRPRCLSLLLVLGVLPFCRAGDTFPPATRVQFTPDVTSLDRALAALTRQSQVPIVAALEGDPSRPLKLTFKEGTFWQALDAVAEAADAQVYLYRGDGKLGLVKRPARSVRPPVSHDGLFRVAIRRVTAVEDFDTGRYSLTASLELAWEPGFLPLYVETTVRQGELRASDNGPSLLEETTGSWVPVDGKNVLGIDLPLSPRLRGSRQIALFKGQFLVRGPSKMVDLAFGTLDKLQAAGETRKDGGASCTVTRVVLRRNVWTVTVNARIPEGGPVFESFQTWTGNSEARLVHKDGRVVRASCAAQESGSSTLATVSYNFTDAELLRGKAEEWRFAYRMPASLVEAPVKFQFKGVPLP